MARHYPNEKALEDSLVSYLWCIESIPRRQVPCAAGVADVVTDKAVYEVELFLDRHTVFHAAGQAALYGQAINPQATRVIVALPSSGNRLIPLLRDIGIEVAIWDSNTDAPMGSTIARIEAGLLPRHGWYPRWRPAADTEKRLVRRGNQTYLMNVSKIIEVRNRLRMDRESAEAVEQFKIRRALRAARVHAEIGCPHSLGLIDEAIREFTE